MPTPRRRHPLQLRGGNSPYSSHLLSGRHLRRRNNNNHARTSLASILCSPRARDLALQCAVLGALSLFALGTVLLVGAILSLLQERLHPTIRPDLRGVALPAAPVVVPSAASAYAGRLEIRSLRDADVFARLIDPIEDARLYEQQRSFALLQEDHRTDASASSILQDRYAPHDELDRPRDCERTAWRTRSYRPTCNAFHELATAANLDRLQVQPRDGSELLLRNTAGNLGASHQLLWRLRSAAVDDPEDFVQLRQVGMGAEDAPTARTLHESQAHARVAEALTDSPRIGAIYGSCGLSDLGEEDESPSGGPKLLRGGGSGVSASTVLDRAIALAEALAELHGAVGGVAVHNALRRENSLLLPSEASSKLRHFYRVEFLDWSAARHSYCAAPPPAAPLDHRINMAADSSATEVTEQADVRAMASILYELLTGSEPAGDPEYRQQQVDERIRTRGFAEDRLADLIVRAWSEDSFSAFDAVRYLRDVQRAAAAAN